MTLLFDNNLSHKLVAQLKDIFPGTMHVMNESLDQSSDEEIWSYAKNKGLTIVTKDSDFNDFSVLRESPPKVIWIRSGNCSVSVIEGIIRTIADRIKGFLDVPGVHLLRIENR